MFGTQAPVTVRTAVPCDDCEATGAAPGTTVETCAECGGAGQVRRVRQSLLGQMVTASPCPRCGGSGSIVPSPCPTCRGDGRLVEDRTYTVDIPAGIDTGSTLRLTGRGAVGPRGGPFGDLYVHIRVRPHDRFARHDYDLVHELHVPVAQAALGAHLTFATLDGDEDLVIPRGTQTGRVFRLRGRGVPHVEGRGRGDLLVQVVVDTPTDLTDEQEEALRHYAELRGDEIGPARQRAPVQDPLGVQVGGTASWRNGPRPEVTPVPVPMDATGPMPSSPTSLRRRSTREIVTTWSGCCGCARVTR